MQVSVFIIIGLVLLLQNLNPSVINDFKSIFNEEKSEDFYKLKFALENGCLPVWVTEPELAKYNGRDVIKSYGRTKEKEYVWYADLTAENVKTGAQAIWKCDGIESLDLVGNPIPTDEKMHQGAIYDNDGNIVATERKAREEQYERERQQQIYQKDDYYYNEVVKFEGGKIWDNKWKSGDPVGTYEGGESGGAAAAFLLLL